MELSELRTFLMWCTVINMSLLALWTLMLLAAPGTLYATQKRWFPLSQDQFRLFMYGFLALFKILVVIFNLVPWLVLLIIG